MTQAEGAAAVLDKIHSSAGRCSRSFFCMCGTSGTFYAICNKNANINVFSYLFVVPHFSNIYISLLMQNKRLFKFISRRIHIQTHMADRFW